MQTPDSPVAETSRPDHIYGTNYGAIPPGSVPRRLKSYADMLASDGGESPLAVTLQGNHQPKPSRIPYHYFWDPEIARLEDERIWQRSWICAGREEDIPHVGDRMPFTLRGKSYLLVRVSATEIRAFNNTCRHRGRTLCDQPEGGQKLRCKYHAWTWKLDGSPAWIPSQEDFPTQGLGDAGFALTPVRCDTWGGNIFINADLAVPPLEKSLGVLKQAFEGWDLGQRRTALHLRKKIRANWKVAQDAFQEAYHVTETHWDTLAIFNETETIYDCWQDGPSVIGRLITPTGVPSGYLSDRVSTRKAVELYLKLYSQRPVEPGRGESVEDARDYLADMKRQELEQARGEPMQDTRNPVLLDFVKFNMFPNFHPWWGEQFPMTYRFLPHGLNPEECVMEVRMLVPQPSEGERLPAATPIDVDFDERCEDHQALGFAGHIIDQDVSNCVPMQLGMRSAAKDYDAPILARRQEKLIAHWYEHYARVLGVNGETAASQR